MKKCSMKSYHHKGTTASGQLLEVQNSVLPLTTLPPTPPQTSTHYYSCETKLIFCTTKIITTKNFTGGLVLQENKMSVPKELIEKKSLLKKEPLT